MGRQRRPGRQCQRQTGHVTFPEGWNIKPDMVIEMPNDFKVPAAGTIDYQIHPGQSQFHGRYLGGGSRDAGGQSESGPPYESLRAATSVRTGCKTRCRAFLTHRRTAGNGTIFRGQRICRANTIPGWALNRLTWAVRRSSFPRAPTLSSRFITQPTAKPALTVPKLVWFLLNNRPLPATSLPFGPNALNLVIAPGDNHAEVVSEVTVGVEATLVEMQPHMHLRGKDYEVRVMYPSGESETDF